MNIIEGGNIFDSKCIALVNPINCVGVCGSGLALEFKRKFPDNYKEYKKHCLLGEVKPGRMLLTGMSIFVESTIIINFPTKDHWKNPSKIKYIIDGLLNLQDHVFSNGITSIAFPLLGCGLGGLKRRDVERMIEEFDRYVNSKSKCLVELYV